MNQQEFFSHELLGMPPQRQIDRVIELVHGVTPTAKEPYRHFF